MKHRSSFSKNGIHNITIITIDNVESIYAGNVILWGNVYKISNQKITKISNINNISIIDIKVNNNNLYILSENG